MQGSDKSKKGVLNLTNGFYKDLMGNSNEWEANEGVYGWSEEGKWRSENERKWGLLSSFSLSKQ